MTSGKTYAELAANIAELQERILQRERANYFDKQAINAIIDSAPDTFRKKYRMCVMCQDWTLERWSAQSHVGCTCCKPQCTKHTKSRDTVAMAILAEVFHGNPE